MRILHLGGSYFVSALRRQGHEVFSVALNGGDMTLTHPMDINVLLQRLRDRGFVPDLSLYCDNGNLPLFFHMETLPCLSFFYSIDTYCNDWHMPYMQLFDYTFVAQREYAHLAVRQTNDRVDWLPLFAFTDRLSAAQSRANTTSPDSTHITAWLAARDLPAAFVGTLRPRNIPDRLPFLQMFQKLHPLEILQGDYVPIFQRTRVVLNQTAVQELNFRCFEAMACGAVLLTESSPHGLEELFTPGRHILPPYTHGNAPQAAATVRAALRAPEELATVALQGQDLVFSHHMDTHRAATLVAKAVTLLGEQLPEQRLRNLPHLRSFARTAHAMIALDIQDPALEVHRNFFLTLATAPD